jgi:hypothetical protein
MITAMPRDEEPLEWSVELGAVRPERRYIVLAVALGAAFIGLKLGGILLSAIGLLVVLLSTAELFLPLRYRIDADGARVRCGISVTAITWTDVKRLIPMRDGVRLSPLDRASRLDEFRGVYLRFGDIEGQVSGKIREFWHGDTSALDRRLGPPGDRGPARQAGGRDPEAEA